MLTRSNTLCQSLQLFDEYKLRISQNLNDEKFELENNRLLDHLRYVNKIIRREDRMIKQIDFQEISKNFYFQCNIKLFKRTKNTPKHQDDTTKCPIRSKKIKDNITFIIQLGTFS